MITFIASVTALILGYIFYGKFVERFFGASQEIKTPVQTHSDGVDFKEIKPWRAFIIQFLNIAGLGPIFGAILGAAYGPVSYIWIVLGCIFMGAVHDYFSGMLSIRNDGISLPMIIGKYLGNGMKSVMIVLTFILLLGVGISFVTGPSDLLHVLTGWNKNLWLYIIFAYYLIATLLPIDKIIGNIYPFFGALLIFMALAVGAMLLVNGFNGNVHLVELSRGTFRNFHDMPASNILVPMLFIVISCGAISGFHATQSPLMARCLTNEKYGRPVFYGAMIAEGIVALIWATAAMAIFNGPGGLNEAAASGMTPTIIVDKICNSWLGKFGGLLAIIGVIVCPITSGDTAFRSMRLIFADGLKINQKPILNRFAIAIPFFIIAYLGCQFDFSTVWKYVGIGNQTIATISLWAFSEYLRSKGKCHLPLSVPATFLTFVCVSYFMIAPHIAGGLALDSRLSYIVGTVAALGVFIFFLCKKRG